MSNAANPAPTQTTLAATDALPQFPRSMPSLDGMRGTGLILVVAAHQLGGYMSWAWVAMQAFFLFSGLLITNGLLATRNRTFGGYLKTFYWHRFLRIAPPYYLYLAVISVVAIFVYMDGTGPLQIALAATYTYNFYHASAFYEHSYMITHFWTLAVEEQFYLLWPLLLFFYSGVALRRILWVVVLAGPILRALTAVFWAHTSLPVWPQIPLSIYVLSWSHFDAFAMGAMISIGVIKPSLRWLGFWIATVGVLGFAQMYFSPGVQLHELGYPFTLPIAYQYIWGYTVINACGAYMIAAATQRRFFPWIFENPVLVYLGRISYTVYIVHYGLQALLHNVMPDVPVLIQLAIQLPVAVGIGALSQLYIEAPARRFRNRWWGRDNGERRSPVQLEAVKG